MTNLIAQEDEVISGLLLSEMAGQVPKIQAREELGGFLMHSIVLPTLPGGVSQGTTVWLIYHLHNGC